MSGLVVTAYRASHRRMVVSLMVTTAMIVAFAIYEYAYRKASQDQSRALEENARYVLLVADLRDEISRLREQNALLTRTSQVEHQTFKELESTVTGLQDQISALKGELAFYRTVAAPQDAARGLRVGGFEVTRKESGFHYRITLTQVTKNESAVDGELSFAVEGTLNGKPKVLPFKQISPNRETKVPFKLKYFGTVEGDIEFPAEFVPARVVIKVAPSGKKHPDFEESVSWPAEES